MTSKLELLKEFCLGENGPEVFGFCDTPESDTNWPTEKQLEKDTLYVYSASSYNYGIQSIDFYTSFCGEQWHVKHDVNASLDCVLQWTGEKWIERQYEIVTKCELI